MIAIAVAVVLYVYAPRRVSDLIAAPDAKIARITVSRAVAGADGAANEIVLSQAEQERLLRLFRNSYARKKGIRRAASSEDFVGCFLSVETEDPTPAKFVYFFTTDLLSVDSRQYKLYGDALATEFLQIIERGTGDETE